MNLMTRQLSPSVTGMIRMDHTHVMALFHKIAHDTSDTVREAATRSICAALEIHAQLEEEVFYPALRAAGAHIAVLDQSVPEHEEMRRGIANVRSLQDQPAAQSRALRELMNGVMHHVANEETQVLPEAELLLGANRLADLGAEMTALRLELVKPRAAELATDLAKSAPAKTALMAVGALVAGSLLIGKLWRSRSARNLLR